MIRCIIVEDEPLAQEVLENYIISNKLFMLIKKCSNALEAFDVLHSNEIDLMFLDIKMPGINGLDFVKSLKKPPAMIFTTAFANYAVDGFELEAVDYLLKPITYERFDKAVKKLLRIQSAKPVERKEYTYFKVSGRLIKVSHNELVYARAVKDYISLCTTHGNYLTHMTMKYLEELLPAENFIRLHRSYLVNKKSVDVIEKSCVRIGEELIPIGENYRQKQWLSGDG